MGIRERMNRSPRLVAAVFGWLVVLCIAWAIYGLRTRPQEAPPLAAQTLFYTDDDGQSHFVDAYGKIAADFNGPHGQPAVRAYVFQYSGEKPSVGYMETYTPAGKKMLREFYSNPANKDAAPPLSQQLLNERLYKRPGMKQWISYGKNPAMAEQIRAMEPKGGELPLQLAP